MRNFWSEFRNFAVKGNAMDLAIAVVIGNAFSGVVNSLVADIITPVIGLLTNHVDFKTLAWRQGSLVITYGNFFQAAFNFLVISLSIFLVFQVISGARKRIFRQGAEKATPPEQKSDEVLLLEQIRDLLKKGAQ